MEASFLTSPSSADASSPAFVVSDPKMRKLSPPRGAILNRAAKSFFGAALENDLISEDAEKDSSLYPNVRDSFAFDVTNTVLDRRTTPALKVHTNMV